MTHFSFPITPLAAAVLLASGLAFPGAAPAQTAPQEAMDLGLPRGACGQPLGLTRLLPIPVDIAGAPAPSRLQMVRFEPIYLEFSLTAPNQVSLQTQTVGEEGDPFLTVFASDGSVIDWDDDGAGYPDALLTLDLGPGSYCAQVRMLDSPTQMPAEVVLSLGIGGAPAAPPAAPETPGLGPGDIAAAFPAGAPCHGRTDILGYLDPGFGRLAQPVSVPRGGNAEWILGLDAAMTLRIDATSSELDTVLSLHSAEGRMIAENDDFPGMGTDSSVTETLGTGLYCVSVRGFGGSGGAAVVTVQEQGAAAPAPGPAPLPGDIEGGAPQPAAPVDLARPCGDPALTDGLGRLAAGFGALQREARVETGSRADWTLSLAVPMELQIDASSTAFDTVLSLLDARGAILAENDDFPGLGTDSRIVRNLAAGDYCLSVRGFGGSGGTMTLAVAEAGGQPGFTPTPTPTPAPVPGPGFAGDPAGPCGDPAAVVDLGRMEPGGEGFTASSQVPRDGRADWFVQLSAAMDLRIEARGADGLDTVLTVLDDTGSVIAENDDAPNAMTTDSLIEQRLDAGSYCLSVRGFGGGSGLATLVVSEQGRGMPASPAQPAPAPAGGVLQPDGPVEDLGTLQTMLEANQMGGAQRWWLAFDMPEPGSVGIDALNLDGGFTLRVADAGGAELFSAESWGGLEVLQIEERLGAGRHLIVLEADSAQDAGMRRMVITRR